MGHLLDFVKLNNLVYGQNEADAYKKNCLYFSQMYSKTQESVKAISITDIKPGIFYFLHYADDSNWMKYSPVFVVDFKKFDKMTILNCVNLNFLPLPIRVALFDPYIKAEDFENKNFFIKAKYDVVYRELKKFSFQWSMMEFNAAQIVRVHKIAFSELPRFIYSGHPLAKYDPGKLTQIWKAKYKDQEKRDAEMMKANIDEFYDAKNEISDKYDQLKDHIKRLQKSNRKYGGGG